MDSNPTRAAAVAEMAVRAVDIGKVDSDRRSPAEHKFLFGLLSAGNSLRLKVKLKFSAQRITIVTNRHYLIAIHYRFVRSGTTVNILNLLK